jgi:dTDP-4-amino-4,6-dideoxygalactose transaminase
VHYPRAVTGEPAYAHLARHETPNAVGWAAECVSLPCYPELTDEEVERICAALG